MVLNKVNKKGPLTTTSGIIHTQATTIRSRGITRCSSRPGRVAAVVLVVRTTYERRSGRSMPISSSSASKPFEDSTLQTASRSGMVPATRPRQIVASSRLRRLKRNRRVFMREDLEVYHYLYDWPQSPNSVSARRSAVQDIALFKRIDNYD